MSLAGRMNTTNWIYIGLKYIRNFKETDKHHVSLHIRIDRCSAWRGTSLLKAVPCIAHFDEEMTGFPPRFMDIKMAET
jgi:hypothetical protein